MSDDSTDDPRVDDDVPSKVPNWPLYLGIVLSAAVVVLNLANPMLRQELNPPPAPVELPAWDARLDATLYQLERELDAELALLEAP